jgi:hypothetical protein
LCYC